MLHFKRLMRIVRRTSGRDDDNKQSAQGRAGHVI